MNKLKVFLVLAFLVVLAAGAVLGMAVDRHLRASARSSVDKPRGGPWRQLQATMTDDQRTKMHGYWSEVDKLVHSRFDARHQLSQKRDQEIQDLLTPQQKEKYAQIQSEYRTSVKEVEDSLQDAVRKAEEETRAMLTPEQQKIYDDIRARVGPPGRRGGPFPRGPRPHQMTVPTTAPAI